MSTETEFRQVGELPDYSRNRRVQRAPLNPIDKSTIISIFPKRIEEHKVTLTPPDYIIEPGTFKIPSTLIVETGCWWMERDEKQPLIEIPVYSTQVAESLVRDYCIGLFGVLWPSIRPGLFYVPGAYTPEQVREDKNIKGLLLKAQEQQRNWYLNLVRITDALWSRSNGNPLTVSDDARLAARELDLKGKDWMMNITALDMVRCINCGSSRNPDFPTCPVCHVMVDKELGIKLGLVKVDAPTSK